jgi:hypothetical protein
MKYILSYTCVIFLLLICVTGCSSFEYNSISDQNEKSADKLAEFQADFDQTGTSLMGVWTAEFDINQSSVIINPSREPLVNYNVTALLPQPEIRINSYDTQTQIIDIDVTIENSYAIDVYDVRLIIYTDNTGHLLVNDDGWLNLFDIPGGFPANPFIAYAKTKSKRKFSGLASYTENLKILLPGGNPAVTFAITASYPENCLEPYYFTQIVFGSLNTQPGDFADAGVSVKDWQRDVEEVYLSCEQVTSQTSVPYTKNVESFSWEWRTAIYNMTGVPVGDYPGYICASSSDGCTVKLYKPVTISVTEKKEGWGRGWGGFEDDAGLSIITDTSGNVYTFGFFTDSVDFDPGLGEDIHVSNGKEDLFLTKYDNSGNFLWARTWGGTESDIFTFSTVPKCAIVTDLSGNIYVTGQFQGTVDFDPGPAEMNKTSNGYFDTFLSKFDSDGNILWVGTWGGTSAGNIYDFDCGYGLAFDNSGNLYVTGSFTDTTDFDPSGDGIEEHTISPVGVFLSKFEPDGDFLWVKTWGGGYGAVGYGVTVDFSDNVYVTGRFRGYMIDFDPGPTENLHSSKGGSDAFLSKFDSAGNFSWALTWGGNDVLDSNVYGIALVSDSSGNIYVGGGYTDTTDFDPGPETDFHGEDGINDFNGYVSKFDPDGNYLWVVVWGVTNNVDQDDCTALTIDAQDNIFATRRNTSSSEWVIGRFNTGGAMIWSRNLAMYKFFGCCTDHSGNVFLTGHFCEPDDFDPGPGEDYHVTYSHHDAFLEKLLPNGYWD